MKIVITGGTGFIGTYLSRNFLKSGHAVTAFGTRSSPAAIDHPDLTQISVDTTRPGPWQDHVAVADVVINLAGKSIFKRWSPTYKEQLYDSRILTTRHVVAALPGDRPVTLFSASAMGYYGNRKEDPVTEKEPPADDFLGRLCRDWETKAQLAEKNGHRVIRMRLGVVLGRDGGAFKQMATVFRRFAGGTVGDGRQWFPWIHIRDVAGAVAHLLARPDMSGPVNFCAPEPLRNRGVAKAFGHALNRPAGLAAPSFMLRLILGEFSETLLVGQRAVPDELLKSGFTFRFPRLDVALANLVG